MQGRTKKIITIGAIALLIGISVRTGYTRLRHYQQQRRMQAVVQNLPSPSSYGPQTLTVQGTKNGFHSRMVASVTPSDPKVYSDVSGYWVLTYTGFHPPIITGYDLTGVGQPPVRSVLLTAGGLHVMPTKVGHNHYVYWIIRWHHQDITALSAPESRQEIKTSQITLYWKSHRLSIDQRSR